MFYQTKAQDILYLQNQTTEATSTDSVDITAKTWQEIEHRSDILRATEGAYVQVY